MNAVQKITESSTAADNTRPRMIGVHIKLPPPGFWNPFGPERVMMRRLILSALSSADVLPPNETPQDWFFAYGFQFVGMAMVTRHGPALTAVAGQLASVDLLADAHLAFDCPHEAIWRTERPLPEKTPFQQHLDDLKAFMAQYRKAVDESRNAAFVDLAHLTIRLAELLSQKSPRQPEPPKADKT